MQDSEASQGRLGVASQFLDAASQLLGLAPQLLAALSQPKKPLQLPLEVERSIPRANPNRFQILSINGGGIRGMFAVGLLAYLEELCNTRIEEHFDLIAGTSTGGIIAIALGFGIRPHEILQMYEIEGPKIFKSGFFTKLAMFLGSRFKADRLDNALKGLKPLNADFGTSAKRLVIPAFDLRTSSVKVFRTPHCLLGKAERAIPAWMIARATASAPTYFSGCDHIPPYLCVDGGLWANDPCIVALVEAMSQLKCSSQNIRLLNVGTLAEKRRRPGTLHEGGLIAYAPHILSLCMDGQQLGARLLTKQLLRSNYCELNQQVPTGDYSLDKVRSEDFKSYARQAGTLEYETISALFLDKYIAKKYSPIPV